MASHFNLVDQSTNYLKKIEQYISAGMDTTIEVAEDVIKGDKNKSNPKLNELRDIMVEYANMDRDLHQFLDAVDAVKKEAKNRDDNLETFLDQKLKQLEKQDRSLNMKEHEKYVELEEKIEEAFAAENEEEEMEEEEEEEPQSTQSLDDSGLMVVTGTVNTKCPYTGMEMKDPVRNIHCNHNYEREGAKQLIKLRGTRAKCPVSGCINEKPVTAGDLEDNKELKQIIMKSKSTKSKPAKRGRRN